MSQWTDRVASHSVFAEINEFRKSLDLTRESSVADATLVDNLDRADAVLAHIETVLKESDPLLVVVGNLTNIASYLQQARGEMNAFASDRNIVHWNNTLTHFDNCLAQLGVIPRQSVSGIDDMRTAAASYRSSVSGWMDAIKTDANGIVSKQAELQTRITEAVAEVTAQKLRIDTAISTFQQQFSDAQQTRQTEYAASEQKRVETATKGEQDRQTSFDDAEKKRASEAEKASKDAAKQHDDLVVNLGEGSKAIVNDLEGFKAHAQKLVGIITETGMAHGYQKTANEEKSQAGFWKGAAVVALIVWIVVGVGFFYLTYDKELTWATVARQTLISTPFLLLAGFAALQVTRHEKNERRFRQAELELASIDPFLATLTDTERNQVKREFATRYFGQIEVNAPPETENLKLTEGLLAVTKTLQEIQKSIK